MKASITQIRHMMCVMKKAVIVLGPMRMLRIFTKYLSLDIFFHQTLSQYFQVHATFGLLKYYY